MVERKGLSKKKRFEIFKRDGFKCQYCGRSAPDVILEVDHLLPVAEGGKNDDMNLITSCRDCNRGNGKRLLSESEVLQKQKAELEELNEKREQMEMMIRWKTELRNIEAEQVEQINQLIFALTGFELSDAGKMDVLKYLKRFTFQEIYDATETSFLKYYDPHSDYSFAKAMNKIGGICYNRRRQNG